MHKSYVRTEYIGKFRGLESPVIIVWAPKACGDDILFSAYSRATSLCIVIYSLDSVAMHEYGKFGGLLLDSSEGSRIRELYDAGRTSNIIKQLNYRKIDAVINTGNIAWYPDWGGFVVECRSELEDSDNLWIDHLCLATDYPIYYWDTDSRGTVLKCAPRRQLTDYREAERLNLLDCDQCGRTTLHVTSWDGAERKYSCQQCQSDEYSATLPPSEVLDSLATFDKTLFTPNDAQLTVKRQLSISLIALGRWRSLDSALQNTLQPVRGSGRLGYEAALILVAVDIANARLGDELTLTTCAKKYYRWCPTLGSQVTTEEWHRIVSSAFATWIHRGWLRKERTGVYSRIK